MRSRRHSRPIETLRSALKTEDIEQVMAAMFPMATDEPDNGCAEHVAEPNIASATDVECPDSGAPELGAPVLGASELHQTHESAPPAAAPVSPLVGPRSEAISAPELGAPDLSDFIHHREPARPRPWISAQDAHTHAEQNLYQVMFNKAKPMSPTARGLIVGVRTLAKMVPMAYSNCHENLKSLIKKLAITERPTPKHNDGRFFIVYTYDEILRRRRNAGLTHVLKRTRAVSLVNPQGAPEFSAGAPELGAPQLNPGAPELSNAGAPGLRAAFIRNKETDLGTSSTTNSPPSPVVITALLETLGRSDDDAAQRIMNACRQCTPDVTDQEIGHFIRQEGSRLLRMRQVDNPMGILIHQVPLCCRGESFRLFRDAELKRKEAEHRKNQEIEAEWRRVLENPDTSDQEKEWAREALEKTKNQP